MAQVDSGAAAELAARLRAVLVEKSDPSSFGELLTEDVRWGGAEEAPEVCHGRQQVLARLAQQSAAGVERQLVEVLPGVGAVVLGLEVSHVGPGGARRGRPVHQVLTLRDGLIASIRGYPDRSEALVAAGIDSAADQQQGAANDDPRLTAHELVPILNVSDLAQSFAWFAQLGWSRQWDWAGPGGPPSFGSIKSGDCEIFLSLNDQGARGVWLAVWVDDVDTVHAVCQREGIDVVRPPRDEPWGVREMHVRHPDGHVLRVSQPIHHSH